MSKYYAVLKGRSVGIFNDWESTKISVDKFPGAIYKSFRTAADAQKFLSPSDVIKEPYTDKFSKYSIYTDGSHSKGYGGVGIIFVNHQNEIFLQASEKIKEYPTTNIRAELFAILRALELSALIDPAPISIYTDSEYSVNVLNKWIYDWSRNNWLTTNGTNPKNMDLISPIFNLLKVHPEIKLNWVQGHADNEYNKMADQLAKQGRLSE